MTDTSTVQHTSGPWKFTYHEAAGPDLLEAARLAVIELEYVAHAEAESNALPLLRAAIAKAEGRE